uniref:Uncharacterized protein n=1 Tax=Glossina austeni TaxID=7395 RepID=A0A1A9US66_GLOAU
MWINFEDSPFEDETISNAFSSRGIYRITSDKEVQTSPQVQASVQNQRMVLAIDTTLFLLEDETSGKCNMITFESNIDCLLISATGNLILCSLSNGEVHGISISGHVLFSPCIRKEDINVTGGQSFASMQQLDRRYCLVCSNGSVYGLSEFDEKALEATLYSNLPDSEVESVTIDILNHVTLNRLFSIKGLQEIKTALLLSQGIEEVPLLLAGTCSAFYQRNCQKECVLLTLPEVYNGVKHVYNLENKIILLMNSGHLLKYCPLSQLLMLANAQDTLLLIDELMVMECNGRNIEFLILTKSNEKSRSIKMIDYPSFKCLNELEVGDYVWLVQQPKSSVNLYYISGQENNSKQHPTILELIMVSETDPSERYKKLINKGYLDEAEDFGKKFELCLQPIYEATAKHLLRTINAMDASNTVVIEEQFSILITLLKKIEDKQFFREARMFSLPSRHILEKYLQEILKYLDNELDEQYILEIVEQLHRLKTLAIIDPYEVNSDWLKFIHHPNLIKYITGLFKTDMPLACLIWKRHASSLMSQLNKNELRKLMNLIPHDTKPFNFLQWLKVFVPIVYNTHPNVMPYITEWSMQKTRALQYSEHWPDIGLEFCTKVMEVFEEIDFMHSDVRRQHERNINKLRELVNALQDLFVLKKTYNLIFTLDSYLQDCLDETAKCILRRVHLDNLKSLINDFLYPIYQEKSQSPVAAIKCYISLLVASRNSFSCWLERSVACVELLHNEDDRLELALLVLQNSPVPWSDVVAPLFKFRYSSHPMASKINTEYELQVIKLMKAKYGWPTDSAADVNLNLFAFRIVKMNSPDMLDDIRILTEAAPEIAVSANFNCCYQLVKNGKLDVAYEFFKSLKLNKGSKCIREVVELFAKLLENTTFVLTDDNSLEEQCELIKFFKLIAQHAERTVPKRYEFIQNRFILLCKYGIKTNDVSELMINNNCSKLLDMGIENIIKRKTGIEDICKYFMLEIKQLSKALNMTIVMGIKQLCCRTNCLLISCTLAYNVMQVTDCDKINKDDYIDLALVLIKQQIDLTESASRNTSAPLLNNIDPLAFPLAYELLTQASFQERNNLLELTELINFLRIARDNYAHNAIDELYNQREKDVMNATSAALNTPEGLVHETTLNHTNNMNMSFDIKAEIEKLKKRVSLSIFDKVEETSQSSSISLADHREHVHIVKFVSHTLLFLLLEAPSTNHLILHLKDLLTDEDKIKMDIDCARESFFLSLEHLIKIKKHRVWYTMAQYLIDYQQRHRCNLINTDFLSLQMTRVLRNDMSTKNCNFLDLFVMLTADPHSHMLLEKLSQEVRTNQQKVNYLTLAEMYNIRFEELIQAEVMRTKRIKHYYYMEFCKQDSTLTHKFNAEIDSIEMLLKEVHNKQVDVQLLERVSRDFDLDYQKLLVTQIVSILQSQEMQYEIKTDIFGDEELVMLSNVEQIRTQCQPYIKKVKNTDLLTSELKLFIKEIHIYFYELYLAVIELLVYFDAVPKEMQIWIGILHFLKHKMIMRRRNRPGQCETDLWFASQKEIRVLPKIARYRLPFKSIVEHPLKDTLDSELNVDNCESWFPLIQMHTTLKGSRDASQNNDYFCMSAVKNSIAEYKSKGEAEIWHLQPTNNAFLQSILRLVKHVHNLSKAFLILYFVSNYAPDGADQVEASYECYKFVMTNEKLINDPKYQEQIKKIKRNYPVIKTQHLLHVYGLNDEDLIKLVENPSELIHRLYHHEIILKGGKLDINTLVKEIAELHDIKVEKIQFKLLQKWLSFTSDLAASENTLLDETLYEDQNIVGTAGVEDVSTAAENVKRANYILASWPKDVAVQFLIGHMYPPEGMTNTSKQLQIYECYFKLYDGSTDLNNILDQQQYITVKCVHELKKLGYNSSLEKFKQSDKIDILKIIWQSNANNPHALQLLANICLGFDIHIDKIWNGILKGMVKSSMYRDLNALVDVLSCYAHLLHIEGLTKAWEWILLQPFKNASQTKSAEQEDKLHKTLFRLQAKFAEHCLRLGKHHMAAVLMAFCKTPEQREAIKQLITQRNEIMRQNILELEDVGILSSILNFVLKELRL